MIQESIHKLIEKKDLSRQEAYDTMTEIMSGNASEPLIASFLTALRMKGEVTAEIAGCAQAMREKSTKIETKHANVIDTCGTGGDSLGTFNISTASAIVASGAGVVVAKHGNRAISSRCGSADVLKTLGVNIEIPKERVEQCLDQIGIAFLFAPLMHGAMKYATPVRRELGIRTVFNVLGPLTNPAGARRQVLGVFNKGLTELLASVLLDLGTERAMVVHGEGGLDEISTLGRTAVSEIKDGAISSYEFHHSSVGIPSGSLGGIAGGDAECNARIIREILDGKKNAPRDIAVLNAGAAIYISGKATSFLEGIKLAEESIDSHKAKKKLQELVDSTN
ncbi:MAG: anthranilate phosphoribosyltransferase [Bacteroidota bacterium]